MASYREVYRTGRLNTFSTTATYIKQPKYGLQKIGLDGKRDGLIYVPSSYDPQTPSALAILLHGAGGTAEQGLSILQSYADANSILIAAPDSRNRSWDIIHEDAFGPDVFFIDQTLQLLFERYNINQNKLAIGGFSDGASYALCLGLTNGDLFSHILAFSPGFYLTYVENGSPEIYISHGTDDHILPINHCSRKLVPRLRQKGYNLQYTEFGGEHIIPTDITKEATDWFLK